MAGGADGLVIFRGIAQPVAVCAGKGAAVALLQVSRQGIAELLVREAGVNHFRQGGRGAMVIGMTGSAGQAWITGLEKSVQRGWVIQLQGNVGMAGCAAIRHPGRFPERSMAAGTLIAQISMRTDTSLRRPGFRVERSGAEQNTSA